MKRYLFDTSALSQLLYGPVPDKWARFWNDVRTGRGQLILFEPLVSEFNYKTMRKIGKKASKDKVLWFKSLPKSRVHHLDDNDAMASGDIKVEFSGFGLSLVDCYAISVARVLGATLVTMDHSMRDVAKKAKVNCSFLPRFE